MLITDSDAAYIAGLFEGEACFDANNGYPRIRIQMTDLDVIEHVKLICGGGKITESNFNKKRNSKWKTAWGLHINKREEVESILRAILPYMGSRRTKKIEELLEMYAEASPAIEALRT